MNKEKLKVRSKKAIALALTALVAGTAAGFVVDANQSEPVIPEPVIKEVDKIVYQDSIETLKEVKDLKGELNSSNDKLGLEAEELAKITADLDKVLDHVYDNDGNVEYLTEDLDDDEIMEIVDRIMFIDYMRSVAVDKVKDKGVDELHKEYIGEVRIDEDDVERFKVYDDDEDLVPENLDFKDGEGEIMVKVRFQLDDDETKYGAVYKVTFEDGVFEDLDLEETYVRD